MGKKSQRKVTNRAKRFLAAYRQTGQVAPAARIAGITARAHYYRMQADPAYRAAFELAERETANEQHDAVKKWAFEGYEEPVIYQGQLCYGPDAYDEETGKLKKDAKPLTRRRRSEALAMFILKGLFPEKYQRREMPAPPPSDGMHTWEEFIQIYRRTSATDAAPPPAFE